MWGRGMEKMTSGQLQPRTGSEAQLGREGPGLGVSSRACGLARKEQAAAGWDEIFRSPHPQEVETDKQNEMLRCNYPGRPSMSPHRQRAQAPPTCHKQALANEVLLDPLPHQPSSSGQGRGRDGEQPGSGSSRPTLLIAEQQEMQGMGGLGPALALDIPGVRPQLPQPENGAADAPGWERG